MDAPAPVDPVSITLFSVGTDGLMHEYDVTGSSLRTGLVIKVQSGSVFVCLLCEVCVY